MAYTSWRGTIGCIKPGLNPGSTEDLIRMLPEGIGVIPVHVGKGLAREERKEAVYRYEDKVRELAEQKVDVVLAENSGPFMMQGYKGERDLIRGWEKKYKVPIFTSGQNHVNALRAMKVKLICIRPSVWPEDRERTINYLKDAGFETLAIETPGSYGIAGAGNIPSELVYTVTKKAFIANPGADAIYYLGSAMRIGDIVQMVEDDLGIPVVSAITARCWEVQKRLHVGQKHEGYGRLLRELP